MTRAAVALAVLSLLTGARVLAQGDSDKARIDELALPAPARDTAVMQPLGVPFVADQTGRIDREVAVSGPQPAPGGPTVQLSARGERPSGAQLSSRADSRQLAARSASSHADSRPQPAAAIGGNDRCTPGSPAERTPECQAILERRAAEFSAPQQPRLSAEQVLLATRQADENANAGGPSRLRSGRRTGGPTTPDADLAGNQELAQTYLQRPAPPAPDSPAATVPADATAAVAQVLQGLQVGVSTAVLKP